MSTGHKNILDNSTWKRQKKKKKLETNQIELVAYDNTHSAFFVISYNELSTPLC